MIEAEVIDKIEKIEKEVNEIKSSIQSETIKMGGRLKGAKFEEKDFIEAEKSLFKEGA